MLGRRSRVPGARRMKFGLFYEMQLPKPYDADQWDPDAERRIYHEALEQVELADKLGFDYVFEVEHHFLEEYSHSSAPEIFLAATSQRTKNIRLGHGIVITPPPRRMFFVRWLVAARKISGADEWLYSS